MPSSFGSHAPHGDAPLLSADATGRALITPATSDVGVVLGDPTRLAALDATGLLDPGSRLEDPAVAAPSDVTSGAGEDERALTRVVRLAARALGTPVAQLNLITADAQIPRAAYVDPAVAGGDPTAWRAPVALAASICQRVVEAGAPLTIDDARIDPVARDHAAVTRAGLVGYCAVPLRAPRPPGAPPHAPAPVIGTVCVVDVAPRRWTAADVAALEDLAAVAAAEVARRTAERRARALATAARQQAEAVLASIADAFYLLDRDWRFTDVNAAAEPLLQTTRAALIGRTLWEAFPDVAGSVLEGPYRDAMASGRPTSVEAYFAPLGAWFDVRSYPWVGGLMVHFRDVSARKAAEAERVRLLAAMAAERERLRAVVVHAPAPMALHVGPEHRYALVNAAYRRISGGGRDVTGLTVREAFPELAGQGIFEIIDQVYATGTAWAAPETRIRYDRDGTGVQDAWFDLHLEPLRDADGRVDAVLNFSFDVTVHVRARQAAEAAGAAATDANAQLQAQQVEMELLNQQLQEQQLELEITNQQLQENAVELEVTNQQLQENAVELEAQTEELQTTAAHLEDEIAAAERARRETARVLGATADGVLGTDPQGRVTFANAAAARLLGYAPEELAGRNQHVLIHHTRADGTPYPIQECPLYEARLAGTSARVEGEVFWRKDGTPLPVEYETIPVVEGGAVLGAVLTFRDVRERRAAEAERERLLAAERAARAEAEATRQTAEEANAAKSQFLANMSHELRTPLNAIGGYTQLLELGLHGPVTDDQRAALGRVQAAQRRLLSLINDVLNYAKLEGGRVEYDMAAVDVRDVVAEVAPFVEPQLAAKGLTFDVRLPDGPCLVWADRAKLGQVLVNLLSNATKFTDARHRATGAPGRVTVDVVTRPGAAAIAGDEAVFLRVADTGRGIPLDKQAAVFDPFVQVQTGYARTGEGTGLGLAISRDLARGMGGELRVRSVEGAGATFTVVLRRAVSADGVLLDRRSSEERRADEDRRDGEDRRRNETDETGVRESDDLPAPSASA